MISLIMSSVKLFLRQISLSLVHQYDLPLNCRSGNDDNAGKVCTSEDQEASDMKDRENLRQTGEQFRTACEKNRNRTDFA